MMAGRAHLGGRQQLPNCCEHTKLIRTPRHIHYTSPEIKQHGKINLLLKRKQNSKVCLHFWWQKSASPTAVCARDQPQSTDRELNLFQPEEAF